MKIPVSFKVDKKPYAVSLVRHTRPKGTMGTVYYDLRRIEIATHSSRSDRRFTKAEMADTFWHEVTHAILRDMGHSLWRNEKFVTAFSRRLTEVVMTARLSD